MSGTISLWRIGAETRKYPADDLSGGGAATAPGRWNKEGEYVIYCAGTLSIAALETAAHIVANRFPLNRYVVRIDVPDAVWNRRLVADPAELPSGWNAIPAGMGSVEIGSGWYRSGISALLCVPSVIIPEEYCVLINARHADAAGIRASAVRKFEYNAIFR